MAKVPNIKVPVTVDASGVDGQLRKVERKFKDSQARLAKVRAAATPALGALGGGALGGVAGGLGQLGFAGGAAGAAMLAIAAPLLIANKVIDSFAQATKGSTEALKQFNETGLNTTGINSTMLGILSSFEASAKAAEEGPSLFQAFLAGAGEGDNVLLEAATLLKDGALALAAFTGAITSGKSFTEAYLAAQLPTASEGRAQQIKAEMDAAQISRAYGAAPSGAELGMQSVGLYNPVTVVQMLWRALT